jgi:peptidoglycan/xylan/chitin deacetylase (PgdA/CDA1 family)
MHKPRSPARSAISSAMVHPRLIGQASRIHVLREFLEYVEAKGGAWITWRIDIARRWQERHASFPI